MIIIPASSLAAAAPSALSALRLYERVPVGSPVRLYAVGDVGLSGRVRTTAQTIGYAAIFEEVAPLLRSGDVVFGNLECPLVDGEPALFAASPAAAPALAEAGFTLLNLANNHILDYGATGLATTLSALRAQGTVPLGAAADQEGARTLARTDAAGLRIGWLGCGQASQDQGEGPASIWRFDPDELLARVRAVRQEVDVLAVSLHLGFMYLDYPHPEHKALAEKLIGEGVHLVLMHHAHVLQGMEVTDRGRTICYNLGNFILDWQEGHVRGEVMVREQNEGAVFLFDLDRQGVCRAAVLPTWIDETCRVHWATGARGVCILDRLIRISQALEIDSDAAFWRQRSERNTGHVLKTLAFHLRRGNLSLVWREVKKVRLEHAKMLLRWAWGRIGNVSLFFVF